MKPEKVEPSPSLYSTVSSEVESGPRSLLEDLHLPHSTTHSSPPSNGFVPKRIHVSNIPFKWREGDLHQLFCSFGEVKDVSIVTNERGSKGYGFVTFLNGDAADEAIAALSGRNFEGRTIQVSVATCRRNELRTGSNVAGTGKSPYSAELGALLLQQKQMLAQQHLQQFLIAQQNSDLIASALGLPTSNLNGLLGGSLPYPANINLPRLDPISLQLQQLQSQPLLQQLQQQQLGTTVLPTQHHLAAYTQSPTVSSAYDLLHSYDMKMVKQEIGPQLPINQSLSLHSSNEMSVSPSSMHNNRSGLSKSGGSWRYNPY